MSVSRLGFEVDSSQAKTAAVDLDRLTSSAGMAEKAERSLASSSKQAETATGEFSRQVRDASTATAQLERATDMVSAAHGRAVVATRASTVALQAQARAANLAMHNSRQLSFQLIDIGQALATAPTMGIYALQNLGFQVAQIGQLYMGRGGFNQAIKDSAVQVGAFAARLGPIALLAGGVTAAIAGMQHEINQTSAVTVGFGDVALATFQVIRDGIFTMLQPAINAMAPWFSAAWDVVVTATKTMGNNLVRLVLGSFEIIKAGILATPDAFIAAGEAAANGFLSAIEQMVREALVALNGLLTDINGMLRGTGFELPLAPAPMSVKVGRVDIGGAAASQRLSDRYGALDARATDIMNTDYMGQFFDAVQAQAVQNALDGIEDKAGAAGKALKDAADNAKDPWNGLTKEMERMQNALQDAGRETGGILKGLIDGTLSWKDALSQALSVAMKLMMQFNPGLFGGGFVQGLLGGLLGFSHGGVIAHGNVIPFARGGVVNRPTVFPMANGAGLMGEAGPEAIMPLRRGPDGRLGVSAPRQAANDHPMRLELVSRFDADGGFDTAVERASRPVAREESAASSARVSRSFDARIDGRDEERRVRRIRPRSPF